MVKEGKSITEFFIVGVKITFYFFLFKKIDKLISVCYIKEKINYFC